MTAWRVTHINDRRQRHVLHLLAASAQHAQDQADALFGPALCCACIWIGRRAGA